MSPPRKPAAPALLLLLAAALVGCVLPDQFAKLQEDVAEMQAQILRLERQQTEAVARLEAISRELSESGDEVGRAEFADVKTRLDDLARQQVAAEDRLAETNRRIDRLSQGLQESREMMRRSAAPPPPVVPSGVGPVPGQVPGAAAGGSALPSADDLYDTAYADFSKGNYALAISGFEEYAGRYPESDRADNALYWVGECYFSQGNYPVAIEAFDRLLELHPESDRAAAANLKKALCFLNQNQVREAIVQLRYVEDRHPDTDEARVARDKLASLGAR